MSLTTLKDDLLAEFREERIMIADQLEMLDPLATELRKPAARKLLSSGTLLVAEFSCYILGLSCVSVIAFMHSIYPFRLLNEIFYDADIRTKVGGPNLSVLLLATYALVGIIGVCIFLLGRLAREIRLKNEILHIAVRDITTMVGQHLERKAAITAIEQRHMLGMSAVAPVPNAAHTQPIATKVVHAA